MEHDGLAFRDLDHDGVLAPYEDWRLSPEERATDLVGRMTVAEKVGQMMHGTAVAVGGPLAMIGRGDAYDLDALTPLVVDAGVTSMITRLSLPPEQIAAENNRLQELAASGRLGIPMTISTDPRNHFASILGAGVDASGFSQWPGTLGLAAIGDRELVRRFGDIIRQEYRAVGIQMALSPQADIAAEPRWPRTDGTFGSDPALVRALTGAYVEGLQGGTEGVGPGGVAAVVKHWVGYGASRDGFDGHNYYGRFSAFPAGDFQDHVDAFLDAFDASVAGVMPTYNILEDVVIDGVPLEQVGAGFNRQLLDGLLRHTYGYRGVVISDWAITKDCTESCRTGVPPQTPDLIAMPWGAEHLSRAERFAKGVNAGLDQIGGENDPAALLHAVDQGWVTEERIDASVHRILVQKFRLGLFDNPFVDPDAAAAIVGNSEFLAEARVAQRRSVTLVEGTMPAVSAASAVFVAGMPPDAFEEAGIPAARTLEEATVAVVRLAAPFELLHPGHFFGRMQHEGSLDFSDDDPALVDLLAISTQVPTIAVITLDRPAIVTKLRDHVDALLAEYGISDEALVSIILEEQPPPGRLPFRLPESMAEVLAGRPRTN